MTGRPKTMLWEEIRSLDTGVRTLRSFGLTVGAVLIGIALIVLWRRDWTPEALVMWLGGAGVGLVIGGLVVPAVLTPIYRMWMALALVLGFIMTYVVLTIVFYLLITPVGLVMRIFGRDPLNRSIDRSAPSYWIGKEYVDSSPSRLEKFY